MNCTSDAIYICTYVNSGKTMYYFEYVEYCVVHMCKIQMVTCLHFGKDLCMSKYVYEEYI